MIRFNQLLTPTTVALACMVPSAFAANYTAGHGDIGIAYEDEGSGREFHLHYHLGSDAIVDGSLVGNAPDGEEFEAGDIVTIVGSNTSLIAPSSASFNTMTGTSGGQSMWILPQSNPSPNPIPFFGIATEELDFGAGADQFQPTITFEFNSILSGPAGGEFSLYQPGVSPGAFNFFFSSANEAGTVNGDNTLLVNGAGHDHFNWAFSEAGVYEISISVTGTHNTDGVLTSTETFTFNVVPEPSSALLVMVGGLGLLMRRRRLS